MKWQSFLIFFAVLFASFALDASFDNETVAIKPYLADSSSCLSCHSPQEKDTLLKDTAKSCDNKCLTCHKGHHRPAPSDRSEEQAAEPFPRSHQIRPPRVQDLSRPPPNALRYLDVEIRDLLSASFQPPGPLSHLLSSGTE